MKAFERGAWALGTVFGAGYFPLAPGTFASALTVLVCVALGELAHGLWLLMAAGLLFLPACWAAGVCERLFGGRDPGRVVVDEVIGQLITLSALPPRLGAEGWKYWLGGFILFRVLDILKPFPARRAERLPGGFGIITDDVVAGIYGYLALKLALRPGF